MAAGQQVAVAPVGRGAPPGEEAGGGEDEDARADRDDPGPGPVARRGRRLTTSARRLLVRVAPPRDDDRAGAGKVGERAGAADGDAAGGAQRRPTSRTAEVEAVPVVDARARVGAGRRPRRPDRARRCTGRRRRGPPPDGSAAPGWSGLARRRLSRSVAAPMSRSMWQIFVDQWADRPLAGPAPGSVTLAMSATPAGASAEEDEWIEQVRSMSRRHDDGGSGGPAR